MTEFMHTFSAAIFLFALGVALVMTLGWGGGTGNGGLPHKNGKHRSKS